MAAIDITPEALAQFAALPKSIKVRIERLMERLAHWPEVSGVKPLSGDLAGHWRIRTGDYRVQFRVQPHRPATDERPAEPEILIVEKIGHRDGFYDVD